VAHGGSSEWGSEFDASARDVGAERAIADFVEARDAMHDGAK
jgi:hypothetical protein